jgi:hypothetical protein
VTRRYEIRIELTEEGFVVSAAAGRWMDDRRGDDRRGDGQRVEERRVVVEDISLVPHSPSPHRIDIGPTPLTRESVHHR